jgi:hypothetical protein
MRRGTRRIVLALAALAVVRQFGFVEARTTVEPKRIAGGTFEPSGVIHVRDTAGVLFVDDGRHREIFWMELNPDGTQASPAVRVPIAADITDLEGITSDGARVYVVGSQSKKTGFEGDGLVRFRFDPRTRTTDGVERVRGLKAWLAAQVRELRGADTARGNRALNIEAVAWDPRARRLLLGLRTPVVDGHALVIPLTLRDPAGPFDVRNLQVAPGGAIRLPLGGAGIRSLEYDEHVSAFRLIADAGPGGGRGDFRIVEWDGRTGAANLRDVVRYPRSLQPEGIARATLHGRPVSVVVFDTSRFAVMD